MKEKKKIERILTRFHLDKPVSREIRKKILSAKKRTFAAILMSEVEGASVMSMEEYTLKKAGHNIKNREGFMKKFYVAGGMVAVVAVAAAVFFLTHNGQTHKSIVATGEASKATVVFVLGDVKVKRADLSPVKLAAGDTLGKNDVVTTGEKSNAMIQVNDTGVVRVLEKSTFSFSALKENGATEISLAEGSVFSKVLKVEKGRSYKVKTPLCIAAVRGTEFLSTYSGDKSEIQVLGGKVAVDSLDEKKETIADGENGVRVDKMGTTLTPYQLNKVQKLTLEKYALYAYVDDLQDKSPAEMKALEEDLKAKEKEIDSKIIKIMDAEYVNPLDKLRKTGRPLTMIYLRDGSQIAGSVISANEKALRLDTGAGVISVPTDEVVRRVIIK
ncbi:MAG TPA: FecR family protein [Spirochaetota bacterium]